MLILLSYGSLVTAYFQSPQYSSVEIMLELRRPKYGFIYFETGEKNGFHGNHSQLQH